MPSVQIIELTESEINKIGYQIILVAWSKIPTTGKYRKKFIQNAIELTKSQDE